MISLCMIVKNEERYLEDCLKSAKGIADEIIVVDTGSSDNTINIAESFGSKIFNYQWANDFAAARNYALDKCTGNWILYLDADERLKQKSYKEIKKLTSEQSREAYNCTIENVDKIGNRPSVMRYVRLFPNDKNIRFRGTIHEQIEEPLLENGFKILETEIEIIHVGYSLNEDELRKKAQRNLLILLKEYESNQSSYYAFHLGQTYGILNNPDKAITYFQKAVKDDNLKGEYKSIAYRYLAVKSAEKQNWNKAVDYISKSLHSNYEQPTNLMVAAKIFSHLKDFAAALMFCKDACEINRELLSGNKKSFQATLIDEEEILYEGLNISLQSNDKKYFNYFYDKLGKNKHFRNKKIFELINYLINKKSIVKFDTYINEINVENLDLIVTLLNEYSEADRLNYYKLMSDKFSQNANLLNNYGLSLINVGDINSAEELFIRSFKSAKNPSAVFYLVSAYLKHNKIEKIQSLINEAEIIFSENKEIISRLKMLKERLPAEVFTA